MRGQQANQIWQMDVIYISSFGQQKYVHHTIDTCTHFQWATALHSEKADAVITHLLSCFAVMGLPIELKICKISSLFIPISYNSYFWYSL